MPIRQTNCAENAKKQNYSAALAEFECNYYGIHYLYNAQNLTEINGG